MSEPIEPPGERHFDPQQRAIQTSNDLRSHAELAAVFEGVRKFDAAVRSGLDMDLARELQLKIGRLDKARPDNNPLLPPASLADATSVLTLAADNDLSTNDYHVSRRPGEVRIARWLAGDEVETFYDRLQAHFDAGLESVREELRNQSWKQDASTVAYQTALDAMHISLADRHIRGPVREHGLAALSSQTADELNILYLSDHLMGVPVEAIVGDASAPPDDPSEAQLAWFFKLFLLRGAPGGVEHTCFFAFLQKTDDDDSW